MFRSRANLWRISGETKAAAFEDRRLVPAGDKVRRGEGEDHLGPSRRGPANRVSRGRTRAIDSGQRTADSGQADSGQADKRTSGQRTSGQRTSGQADKRTADKRTSGQADSGQADKRTADVTCHVVSRRVTFQADKRAIWVSRGIGQGVSVTHIGPLTPQVAARDQHAASYLATGCKNSKGMGPPFPDPDV